MGNARARHSSLVVAAINRSEELASSHGMLRDGVFDRIPFQLERKNNIARAFENTVIQAQTAQYVSIPRSSRLKFTYQKNKNHAGAQLKFIGSVNFGARRAFRRKLQP